MNKPQLTERLNRSQQNRGEMIFMVLDSAKEGKSEIDTKLLETSEYEQYNLNDLGGKEIYEGEPYLAKMAEKEFDDGSKQISALFTIANHNTKERINGRVKAKSLEDLQTFWHKSLGFEVIKSIKQLHDEPVDKMTNNYQISFNELRGYVNSLRHVTVEVVSYSAKIDDNLTFWNTFKIIKEGEQA